MFVVVSLRETLVLEEHAVEVGLSAGVLAAIIIAAVAVAVACAVGGKKTYDYFSRFYLRLLVFSLTPLEATVEA